MLIKTLELADLEGQDSHQHDDHQQEWVNPPVDQVLHFRSHTCKTTTGNSKCVWNGSGMNGCVFNKKRGLAGGA